MLKFLTARYRVYLGTLWDEPPESEQVQLLQGMCERVAAFPLGRRSRWLRAMGQLARGHSATEGLFSSAALSACVRKWENTVRFDATVVFCSSMVQHVNRQSPTPIIVDLVDVDSQKWFDYAAKTNGPKRWLYAWEGRRLRRLEHDACQRAAAVVLVSDAEAEVFRRDCPNDRTHGVSNGVDLDYFQPALGEGRAGRCVFVGALDYRANIDGIRWFCREVWPAVRTAHPQATLAIVGRNPTAEIEQLATIGGVEVFGSVPDVRPYLADASIAIAPLRIARGTQNKVLEAMAARRPVLASPEALAGLAVKPGQHVAEASGPQRWVAELSRLLAHREDRLRLSEAATAFIRDHHSWHACLTPLGGLIDAAITQGIERKPT